MSGWITRTLASALLAAALPVTAAASSDGKIPDAEYGRINASLLEHHILPRYDRLADAMAALAREVYDFCAGESDTAAVRERYHSAGDAWMAVQHLRFGPVELFMRSYRLYFWPEARGKVAGAVDELLAEVHAEGYSIQRLTEASVAVQGLPAVEHLLYERDTRPGTRACALLEGVTANMCDITHGIKRDWRTGDAGFRDVFTRPASDNAYYDSHRAATLDLFKSFHGGLRLIADVKLIPVVGEGVEDARPRRVESGASDRALRNIRINLEALQAMYLGDGGAGLSALVQAHGEDPELDPLMRRAFRLTLESVHAVDAPLARAVVDGERRADVEQLETRVLALKQIVRSRVAGALGLAVGFNALDGD